MGVSAKPTGLLALGINELSAAYRQRQVSPVETVRVLLDQIGQDQQHINAFCLLDPDAALASARASEQRYREGQSLGRLDGVPVSIKDLLDVNGWPTRRGSLSSSTQSATQDAPSVALLRSAGAVLFGKSTTTEFGWTILSDCPHTGMTLNPHDTDRSAGGSSSGAAAQIAMGWGPLALGSDAGGSVRIPASYCGVVGFKPSFGAIPLAPQSAFAEFAHLGPLTRNMADCISAMSVLSQPDSRDPSSLFPRAAVQERRALRIGWSTRLDGGKVPESAIGSAFSDLLAQIEAGGEWLEEVSLEPGDAALHMWQVWCSRVFESFKAWPAGCRRQLDPRLQQVFETGAMQQASVLADSRTYLREFSAQLAHTFRRIDVLLTPAASTVAPPAGKLAAGDGSANDNWFAASGYAFPFNLSQQPALSLPLGCDQSGLPFGLQVAGRRYHDGEVLAFGSRLESMIRGLQ